MNRERLRFIPPEAFDQPQPPAGRRRRNLWASFAGLAVVVLLGAMVLWPGEPEPEAGDEELMSLASGEPSGGAATSALPETGAAAPRATGGADVRTGESAEPLIGRLHVSGDLPSGVWLELDGDILPGGLGIGTPIRVAAETVHTVRVHADGYEPWASEVYVPADSTVRLRAELRKIGGEPSPGDAAPAGAAGDLAAAGDSDLADRDAEPASGGDFEPTPAARLPAGVRDSLDHRLAQGRLLLDIQRYMEAAEEFDQLVESAIALGERYPRDGELIALRERADSALQAARAQCREAGADTCP